MGKIYYYSTDGKLQNEFEIDKDILENAVSLMSRCYLKNGTTTDGYIDPSELKRSNILKLWTQEYDVVEDWEVNYNDIEKIECILASHPMWGHKLMNKFEFDKEPSNNISDDTKHFYIYVEYIDMPNDRMYCYTSKDETIKKDDYVLVKRNNNEIPAKVINTVYYTDDKAPYPFSKLKYVIEKLPKDYKYYVDKDWYEYYEDEYEDNCSYIGINEKEYIKFEISSFLLGKYEYTLYRATKNGVVKEEPKLYEAGLSDEKFDLLLDKIKENNIDRWDKEYFDNNVLDGETWTLKINTKDIKHKSYGVNGYPKNYDSLINLLEINNVPIDEYYELEEIEEIDDELDSEEQSYDYTLTKNKKIEILDRIIKNIKEENYKYEFSGFGYSYSKELTEIFDVLDSADFKEMFNDNFKDYDKKDLVMNMGKRKYDLLECILCLNHLWHVEGSGMSAGIVMNKLKSGDYLKLIENFIEVI